MTQSNDVKTVLAVLNLRGVRFDNGENPFSAPVTVLDHRTALRASANGGQCRPRRTPTPRLPDQICGIADVNGDGVPDRIDGDRAFLGTGSGFSPVYLPLPCRRTRESGECPRQDLRPAAPGQHAYGARQLGGLRDLTGDGIPDAHRHTG